MNLEIANRLVGLRRSHGLSQEELAAKLGVSRQAVSKWERAESSPDTDNLIALARLYNVSLDGLLLHETEEADDYGGAAAQAAPEPEYRGAASEADEVFAAANHWETAEANYQEEERKRRRKRILSFPYPVLVTIVFLLVGFMFGAWHPAWMLYLTVPIYYCVGANL